MTPVGFMNGAKLFIISERTFKGFICVGISRRWWNIRFERSESTYVGVWSCVDLWMIEITFLLINYYDARAQNFPCCGGLPTIVSLLQIVIYYCAEGLE